MNPKLLWTFAITSTALVMTTLDNLVVTTALPVIRHDLHASLQGLEWTVNAYTLTFAVLLLTGAALGDRFGRRRLFVIGLAIFTGASALAAPSMVLSCSPLQRQLWDSRALPPPTCPWLQPLASQCLPGSHGLKAANVSCSSCSMSRSLSAPWPRVQSHHLWLRSSLFFSRRHNAVGPSCSRLSRGWASRLS